ncbi:hypothetical protein SteCoe_25562 [Stentor coeruleus]|uniref:Uncharacterized protein n=1 Tax=Stentor coeruleus TaxID=5963 RepID=A0A1R2BEX1_9CILI|nr:hypothetical protein SteCoe_25562 [Stentor coeruleus]
MESEHKDLEVLASIGTVDEHHVHHEPEKPVGIKVSDSDFDHLKKSDEPSPKEDKKEHIETADHAFKALAKGNEENKLDEKPEEKVIPRKSSSSSSSVDSIIKELIPPQNDHVEEQDKPNMEEPLKQSKMDFIKSKIPESIKSINKKTLISTATAVSIALIAGAVFKWKKRR